MGRRSGLLLSLSVFAVFLLWTFSGSRSSSTNLPNLPLTQLKWPSSAPPNVHPDPETGHLRDFKNQGLQREDMVDERKGYWGWIEKEYDHLLTWTGKETCKRTLLFVFTSVHGFASEYLLLIRLLLLASHPRYNYTVLISGSKPWNYGPFTSYFLDPNDPAFLGCRPHDGWDSRAGRKKLTPLDPENPLDDWWKDRNHIVWDRTGGVDYLDRLITSLYVDPKKLEKLHKLDELAAVAAGGEGETLNVDLLEGLTWRETIPEAFEEVFQEMSRVARRYWRINGKVLKLVQEVEERVYPDGNEDATLVGVHVRLGDKFREANHMGPGALNPLLSANGSHNPHSYTLEELDHLDVNDIRTRVYVKASQAVANASPKAELTDKKTLVVMSDDVSAVDVLEDWGDGHGWKVVGTEKDEVDEEEEKRKEEERREAEEEEEGEGEWEGEEKRSATKRGGIRRMDLEVNREKKTINKMHKRNVEKRARAHLPIYKNHEGTISSSTSLLPAAETSVSSSNSETTSTNTTIDSSTALKGFSESTFNNLPESERVNLGLKFVRDVTFLAEKTDGVVFTGSSNVGRLLVLLWKGGWEGVQNGGVRSVDVRWFPTAKFL